MRLPYTWRDILHYTWSLAGGTIKEPCMRAIEQDVLYTLSEVECGVESSAMASSCCPHISNIRDRPHTGLPAQREVTHRRMTSHQSSAGLCQWGTPPESPRGGTVWWYCMRGRHVSICRITGHAKRRARVKSIYSHRQCLPPGRHAIVLLLPVAVLSAGHIYCILISSFKHLH